MRTKIVAGNWKMNKTMEDVRAFSDEFLELAANDHADGLQTVVAPPFPFLAAMAEKKNGLRNYHIAAQNCHHEASGAYTGEVAASMIRSAGAGLVIIGHSERRQYFAETAGQLMKKTQLALENELRVIFCIGETLEQRNAGKHFEVIRTQLQEVISRLDEELLIAEKLILAYEPVWAIGTGVTASAAQAQEMHAFIRQVLCETFHATTVHGYLSILYGGSCNASNAAELFAQEDVDGGLVGGASLKAAEFAAIRRAMIAQIGAL